MKTKLRRLSTKFLIQSYLLRQMLGNKNQQVSVEDRIILKTIKMLLHTYQYQRYSVLSGFLVPFEILHLYDMAPMFTEYIAPLFAVTDRAEKALELTESTGFSRDICTFHRATMGAALQGYLPPYQLIIATSHLCDGQNKTLEELALRLNSSYFLLDVPQEKNEDSINYLAVQLEELEQKLIQITGKRASKKEWANVIDLSNQTREYMIKVNQLRKLRNCPLYGKRAFNLSLLSLLMMGTSSLRNCYKDLVEELEKQVSSPTQVDNECYRIVWLLAYPYSRGNIISEMEQKFKMRAVADELSYVYWSPLDPKRPLYSLACKILQNPNLGPVSNRCSVVEELVQEYNVDGVIHYSHWGCRQGCGGVRPIADMLYRKNIPFLEVHGDCIDSRNEGEAQSRTRLQGFFELMAKGKRKFKKRKTSSNNSCYLGIDIGSLTAKSVLIDSSGQILSHKILSTGASSRRRAFTLKNLINQETTDRHIRTCIATGYGRAAVDFADQQVTEISCHAKGMAHQIKGAKTIIDIGGQDTKVISMDTEGNIFNFVMNDKCAAGTGRFLEMMARALEIDIEDLGPLSLKAKKAANISSMCTVFAESEVVSLIAEETPTEIIARGICNSIATRTMAMLDRVGKEKKITMSGGVAKNIGVVKELEKLLQTRITIPSNPQITGALGAALLALDMDK